jgi:hypothetical protein
MSYPSMGLPESDNGATFSTKTAKFTKQDSEEARCFLKNIQPKQSPRHFAQTVRTFAEANPSLFLKVFDETPRASGEIVPSTVIPPSASSDEQVPPIAIDELAASLRSVAESNPRLFVKLVDRKLKEYNRESGNSGIENRSDENETDTRDSAVASAREAAESTREGANAPTVAQKLGISTPELSTVLGFNPQDRPKTPSIAACSLHLNHTGSSDMLAAQISRDFQDIVNTRSAQERAGDMAEAHLPGRLYKSVDELSFCHDDGKVSKVSKEFGDDDATSSKSKKKSKTFFSRFFKNKNPGLPPTAKDSSSTRSKASKKSRSWGAVSLPPARSGSSLGRKSVSHISTAMSGDQIVEDLLNSPIPRDTRPPAIDTNISTNITDITPSPLAEDSDLTATRQSSPKKAGSMENGPNVRIAYVNEYEFELAHDSPKHKSPKHKSPANADPPAPRHASASQPTVFNDPDARTPTPKSSTPYVPHRPFDHPARQSPIKKSPKKRGGSSDRAAPKEPQLAISSSGSNGLRSSPAVARAVARAGLPKETLSRISSKDKAPDGIDASRLKAPRTYTGKHERMREFLSNRKSSRDRREAPRKSSKPPPEPKNQARKPPVVAQAPQGPANTPIPSRLQTEWKQQQDQNQQRPQSQQQEQQDQPLQPQTPEPRQQEQKRHVARSPHESPKRAPRHEIRAATPGPNRGTSRSTRRNSFRERRSSPKDANESRSPRRQQPASSARPVLPHTASRRRRKMNFNEGTISDREDGPYARFDEGTISDGDDFLANWMDQFHITKFNDGFLAEPETDSYDDEGDGSLSDQSVTDDDANWQSQGSGSAVFSGPSGSSITDGEGTDGTGTDYDHTTDDEGATRQWQPNFGDGESTESSLNGGHSSGFTQSEGETSRGEWTDTDDEFIEVGIEKNIMNAVNSFFRK